MTDKILPKKDKKINAAEKKDPQNLIFLKKDSFFRECERDFLSAELEHQNDCDPFLSQEKKPHQEETLGAADFADTFVGDVAQRIQRVYPEIPFSTLLGLSTSLISQGLMYLFKGNATAGYVGHELALPIFFLGELPSGSGKSSMVTLFTDAFEEVAEEINGSLDPELYKAAYNTGFLLPIKDATNAALQQLLQSQRKSVFSLVSTEKSLVRSMFSSFGVQGDHTMHQDAWEGARFSTARVTRTFHARRIWGVICVLTQEGVIKDLFSKASADGLLMRFWISCEAKKPFGFGAQQELSLKEKGRVLQTISEDLKAFYRFCLKGKNFSPSPQGSIDAFWKKELKTLVPQEDLLDELQSHVSSFKKIAEEKRLGGNDILASFYEKSLLHLLKLACVFYASDQIMRRESLDFPRSFDAKSLAIAKKIFASQAKNFEAWFEKEEIFGPKAEEKAILEVLLSTKKALTKRELCLKARQRKVFFSQAKEKSAYKAAMDRIHALLLEKKIWEAEDGTLKIF